MCSVVSCVFVFCFFNDTATTEIYTYGHTLSLHDALPIWEEEEPGASLLEDRLGFFALVARQVVEDHDVARIERRRELGFDVDFEDLFGQDRKSTRLNSSH